MISLVAAFLLLAMAGFLAFAVSSIALQRISEIEEAFRCAEADAEERHQEIIEELRVAASDRAAIALLQQREPAGSEGSVH